MADPLLDVLDRQYRHLREQQDARRFVMHLRPFVATLLHEPRFAAIVADFTAEVAELIAEHQTRDLPRGLLSAPPWQRYAAGRGPAEPTT